MTEHKFTDDEIIRALEICAKNTVGREGYFTYQGIPLRYLCEDALDLINRQKAEIERYEKENSEKFNKWLLLDKRTKERYADLYETAKGVVRTEAIKEFAERLKEKIRVMDRIIIYGEDIDNLVKEMTEDATEHTKVSSHEICVVCGDQVPEGRQVCYMCETGQEFLNKKKE